MHELAPAPERGEHKVRDARTGLPRGRAGGRRADAGYAQATERDLRVLRFVGEQFAVTLPQLQQLLGVTDPRSARKVRDRWRAAGWIECRKLVMALPPLIWLTHGGHRTAGIDYKVWEPSAAMAAHIAAVTDVRLFVAERLPAVGWTCERDLHRQATTAAGRRAHRPDAVLDDQGRQIAIEVELTQKSRRRLTAIVNELLSGYDAAWYFAAPGARPAVEAIAAEAGARRVRVLPLPGGGA